MKITAKWGSLTLLFAFFLVAGTANAGAIKNDKDTDVTQASVHNRQTVGGADKSEDIKQASVHNLQASVHNKVAGSEDTAGEKSLNPKKHKKTPTTSKVVKPSKADIIAEKEAHKGYNKK